MHVSAREDSSSLLPVGEGQVSAFPGTDEVGTTNVEVRTLDSVMANRDLEKPALLKVDVQGFELPVLRGADYHSSSSTKSSSRHHSSSCTRDRLYSLTSLIASRNTASIWWPGISRAVTHRTLAARRFPLRARLRPRAVSPITVCAESAALRPMPASG